jgi:hypothetical protein
MRWNVENAGEFAIMKAGIERFQPVNLLADGIWYPHGSASGGYLEAPRHQSQHPLLAETALEGAHSVWMGSRFLRPLLGRPVGKQHQGTD